MNDEDYQKFLDDIKQREQEWERKEKYIFDNEVKPLLKKLRDNGVDEISVFYSGRDYEPDVGDISISSATSTVTISETENTLIKNYVLSQLPIQLPKNWSKNDGSYGYFTINLEEGKSEIEHYRLIPTLDPTTTGGASIELD